MEWARNHKCMVFTHDLDFGVILALTRSTGPSVLQIRTQDPVPSRLERMVVKTLNEHVRSLEQGALISVDEVSSRIRILPIST